MPTVKSNHPLAQVPYMIAKSVRRNRAVIRYRCLLEDKRTGYRREWHFDRDIWLRNIESADSYLVSQGVYQQDDLTASIPALCLLQTRKTLASDEIVTYRDIRQTLEIMRPWKTATGGIVPNVDRIVWNGRDMLIVNVKADDFWNNDAKEYIVTLRG